MDQDFSIRYICISDERSCNGIPAPAAVVMERRRSLSQNYDAGSCKSIYRKI